MGRMQSSGSGPLRVALVAGTLGRGGAEKQLVYMARSLLNDGADVRIYSLGKGEAYEAQLTSLGLPPRWIGRHSNPLVRAAALSRAIRPWRPHVVQAAHFYVNPHVTIGALAAGALSLGAIRSDSSHDIRGTGTFGPLAYRMPSALLANSYTAREKALEDGRNVGRVLILPNVLDVEEFDAAAASGDLAGTQNGRVVVASVAGLWPVKRLDRFLKALALARREAPNLTGWIVGDGPERAELERLASELALLPDGVEFLGQRADVPSILRQAHVLMLTSEHEGFPNVLLEAMAASLPIISTPSGDAPRVVVDGTTGHIVGMDEVHVMAARLAQLSRTPELRARMGQAGRARVESVYGFENLGARLRDIYREALPWAPPRVRQALA